MRFSCRLLARLFVAVGLLLAAGAAQGQASRKLEVPYTQFSLPNGLNVILHEDHTVPMVCVDAWYYVGSARGRNTSSILVWATTSSRAPTNKPRTDTRPS
jgi:hypothetical protein